MDARPVGDKHDNDLATKALNMAVFTWLGNFAGCLISMVPLALPLGALLVLATVFTGFAAMGYGVLGYRKSRTMQGEGDKDAIVGFVLGTLHIGALAAMIAGGSYLAHSDMLKYVGG